jgi:predicted transposase
MISIKCKITNEPKIDDYIRQFNSVVRFAYNRFVEGKDFMEIYHCCNKDMSHKELLDASFVESAVMKAKQIFHTQGSKVIFGGKKGFLDKKFGRQTQEAKDFLAKRNRWLYSQGRESFKGNRKFNFDLENGKVVFKPSRDVKIPIEFLVTSKNEREMLSRAQFLASHKQTPITVSLSSDYIIFQVDEAIMQKPTNEPNIPNRIMAMDTNPNFLGVTILDFKDDKNFSVVFKKVFDLRKLNKCSQNKIDHETFEMAQFVAKTAKHYRCEIVGYEDLTIKSKDHKKGRAYNKLVNNTWKRRKFFGNLCKWLNIYGVKSQAIAPAYSSFIGQIQNPDEPDMIAAALEIARRTYIFNRVFIRKDAFLDKSKDCPHDGATFSSIVFPEFLVTSLPTRWKEMAETKRLVSWKTLYSGIKKSKKSYRLFFDDWVKAQKPDFSRLKSSKSNILLYFK